MNRTPWDEALVEASGHLADLQNRAAFMQSYISMGLADGCLPVTEEQIQSMEEAMALLTQFVRMAMNHTEKQAMVINDPAVGEEPLHPNQPTYCDKYGHSDIRGRRCGVCMKVIS